MKNLFLFIAALITAAALSGCTVVVHDATPRRHVVYTKVRQTIPVVQTPYCGSCYGHRCGYEVYRSYRSHYQTTVVENRFRTSSPYRRYAPTRTYSAPAAPRQVRRSYSHSTRRQVSRSKETTYRPSRRKATRSRTAVRKAPTRSRSIAQQRADERKREKRRR